MAGKISELNNEAVNLEALLIQLGETRDFLTIKKMEYIRDCLPVEHHCDWEYIEAFYYNYISELYALYTDRVSRDAKYYIKSDKYYNKQNKKAWTQ
jgi:hypothetical protein